METGRTPDEVLSRPFVPGEGMDPFDVRHEPAPHTMNGVIPAKEEDDEVP